VIEAMHPAICKAGISEALFRHVETSRGHLFGNALLIAETSRARATRFGNAASVQAPDRLINCGCAPPA